MLLNNKLFHSKTISHGIAFQWVALALYLLCPNLSNATDDPLRKSLVKIFTTIQNPNYYEPWRTGPQEDISGSGCIISGNRILTNAHVVSNEIFIQVLKDGDSKKYTAKKEFVAHDCDLAILKVDDPNFFHGTHPVKFGGLPFLKDKVAVYGYPVGGEELSITEGEVSRIEVIPYSHSMRNLLGIQTDAAINPGNSGGPVFSHKKLVGVAFQGYNAVVAQNTGYIVPVQLVQRFLKQTKKGSYSPVPVLGIYTETMENDSLRKYYGLKSDQTGVLVSKVIYGSSAWGQVQENDVLLSIDGYPISNDGTLHFRKGERLNFQYPICLHREGDKLALKILRDKKPMKISPVLKGDARLIPLVKYDTDPTYFIFGGLVFMPLTSNYFQTTKSPPSEFMPLYFNGLPSENQKQIVIISHILSHEINKGYGPKYANLEVKKVNGVPITEMKDLITAFGKPQDGRHVIEIDNPVEVGTKIVLDASTAQQATREILAKNNIPSDRSQDLKGVTP
jgi:S1-C subfamily serine protease